MLKAEETDVKGGATVRGAQDKYGLLGGGGGKTQIIHHNTV